MSQNLIAGFDLPPTTKLYDNHIFFERIFGHERVDNPEGQVARSIEEFPDFYKLERGVVLYSEYKNFGGPYSGTQVIRAPVKDGTYYMKGKVYTGFARIVDHWQRAEKASEFEAVLKKRKLSPEPLSPTDRFLLHDLNGWEKKYQTLKIGQLKYCWFGYSIAANEVYIEGQSRDFPSSEIVQDAKEVAQLTAIAREVFKPFFDKISDCLPDVW